MKKKKCNILTSAVESTLIEISLDVSPEAKCRTPSSIRW